MEIRNTPPFDELRNIINEVGYEVISMGADHSGLKYSGAINMQIAPKEWLAQTDFINFPQIPQDLVSKFRECAVQSCPQAKGNGE